MNKIKFPLLFFPSKINKINRYTIAAFIIIAMSSSLRLFFIAHNWPETNSDEGTVGLMALHIKQFKDFPAYFYSQGVMGSLEAYVGALLFSIFGTTVFALRFGLLLLFVPFLISMYLLTGLLYSRGFALVTLVLLSICPLWLMIPRLPMSFRSVRHRLWYLLPDWHNKIPLRTIASFPWIIM